MSGEWLVQQTADNIVHALPLDDLTTHDLADDCLCGPTDHPVNMPGGRVGYVTTHHSLDGREAREQEGTP